MNLERGKTKYTPGKWYLWKSTMLTGRETMARAGTLTPYLAAVLPGQSDSGNCGSLCVWCPACARPYTLHVWRWEYPDGYFDDGRPFRRVIAQESGHTIAADGSVSPSVVCTNCNCAFHESGVRLLDWEPKEVEARS